MTKKPLKFMKNTKTLYVSVYSCQIIEHFIFTLRVEHGDVLYGWLVADKFSFGCDIK